MGNYRKDIFIAFVFTVTLAGLLVWAALQVLPAQAGSDLPPRERPVPTQPEDDNDNDRDSPAGAYIELHAPAVPPEAWTVVQWQDSSRNWHDVDGWRGTLDAQSIRRWWVDAKDFNTGPFRWVTLEGSGGAVVSMSEPFNLPAFPNETLVVMLK